MLSSIIAPDVTTSSIPNFDVKNSAGESPLCVALRHRKYSIGQLLLRGGTNVNASSPDEAVRLLHYFLLRKDERAALFLLDNGADVHILTPSKESSLVLCIQNNLPSVLEALCRRGASMEDAPGDACPLWLALITGKDDLASTLVR